MSQRAGIIWTNSGPPRTTTESIRRTQDPIACGLTKEQFAEGKAKGLPAAILAEDQVADPSLKLSPAQQALVTGGEAALWTEMVTEEMLDNRLWPSSAVIAERLWSPATIRDTADMYRRLIVIHDGLRVAGLADDANRRRMAARLAPGKSEPVALLLDLVAPVRNHAHNRMGTLKEKKAEPQEFNELADAASPDSLVARRFELDADRFVRGDRSGARAIFRPDDPHLAFRRSTNETNLSPQASSTCLECRSTPAS